MKLTNLQNVAKSALMVGGLAAAGLVSNAGEAQAQFIGAASQSRVSAATTSILTNGNVGSTNSFAVEIVNPSTNFAYASGASLTVTYGTVAIGASAGEANSAITAGTLAATATTYTASTVEAATSRAIDGAIAASQFGNVGGIVRAYQNGTAVLD
jgi:hypothetical protein